MNKIYLGVDVGTQSVKALCFDAANSKTLAVTSAPLQLISKNDGTREQKACWWLDALKDCLSQVDPALLKAVVAIGVSGQQHGFVPLAADGKVLAPVKLWCDTTTAEECQQISDAFGGEARCIKEVGNAILPGYTAPKIRWLKNRHPELYQKLHTILLPHDYINYYLTGERVMEAGDASGTGLLDIRSRQWHAGMLAAIDAQRNLLDCLPKLVAPGGPIGQLQTGVARELGLPAGIPVSAGGGDNMMAAIGTGNVAPGRMTVSLGTSGTLFAYSDTPVIDQSGSLAAFCSSTGGWLPLLCTMNCTVSTELVRDLFQLPVEELDHRVAQVPAGSRGVMTLPFFNGERSPNLPGGKGCILGLDSDNFHPDNLLRSAMESAIYGLRSGLEAFRRQGCDVTAIRLTGGGARNASWCQMVSDIFNLPVTVQKVDEGAALGAALQACWMHQRQQAQPTSLVTLVDQHLVLDRERSFEPQRYNADRYTHLFQQYLRHVEAITPLYSAEPPEEAQHD